MGMAWVETFLNTIPISMQLVFAVVMPVIALLILWDHLFLSKTRMVQQFVKEDWKYFGVAWVATHFANKLALRYRADEMFTPVIYRIEGEVVSYFQQFAFGPLTWLLAFAYFVLFPVIVLATYFKVKEADPYEAERYAIAYALTTSLSIPIFIFFPVEVTGYAVPGVEPLLYELHPVISGGIRHFDSLVKAFPSLHTGLAVLAALYSWKTTRAYAYMATGSALLIIFSTFYLGIHWIVDAVAGFLLVVLVYTLSEHLPLEKEVRLEYIQDWKKRVSD